MTKNLRRVVGILERVRAERASGEWGASRATVFLDTPDIEALIEAGNRVLALEAGTAEASERREKLPQISDISEMVREFMAAAEQPILPEPAVPSDERVRLRARLIMEEAFETVAAMFGNQSDFSWYNDRVQDMISKVRVSVDLAQVADGCADLDYVVEGTRLEYGINGLPIALAVHASNMDKFGPGSWRREDGKQMKPEGWQPPDIEAELRKQKLHDKEQETDAARS